MTTKIVALAERLEEAGFDVRIWRGNSVQRIYLNGYEGEDYRDDDAKAWIQLADPQGDAVACVDGVFHGAWLQVECVADRSEAWCEKHAEQVREQIEAALAQAKITLAAPRSCAATVTVMAAIPLFGQLILHLGKVFAAIFVLYLLVGAF